MMIKSEARLGQLKRQNREPPQKAADRRLLCGHSFSLACQGVALWPHPRRRLGRAFGRLPRPRVKLGSASPKRSADFTSLSPGKAGTGGPPAFGGDEVPEAGVGTPPLPAGDVHLHLPLPLLHLLPSVALVIDQFSLEGDGSPPSASGSPGATCGRPVANAGACPPRPAGSPGGGIEEEMKQRWLNHRADQNGLGRHYTS